MGARQSILHHGLSTLRADLDAHTRDIFELFRTGANIFYASPIMVYSSGVETVLTAGKLYALAYPIIRAVTAIRMTIYVNTADVGKFARLGIYANGTNLYPGAKVLDAGLASVNDIGVVSLTISQALTKGLYWVVILTNGVPGIIGASTFMNILGRPDYPNNNRAMWEVDQAYGALPTTFTAGGTVGENCFGPALAFSSLD